MKLILIRGVPGSGKSTLAKELSSKQGYVVCEADHYFMSDGEYKFDIDLIGDAHVWCQANAKYLLFHGLSVIVSNTSVHNKDIRTYYEIAKKYHADFEIINCSGNFKTIHHVPTQVQKRMANSFVPITTEDFLQRMQTLEGNNK